MPVAVSIWLSAVSSRPLPSFSFCARSKASTGMRSPALQALHHARQRVFGNREHDADGRELRDHDDAVGVAGAHDVARVHLAQADAAADRGDDPRVRELQLRVVDAALVGLHRGLVLAHQRLLRVDLLAGNRILLEQRAIARDVDPRVLEQRLVARELPGGERQLHLERPGIDLGQEVARLHHLAFLEGDLHQLAVHAAPDDDGVQRASRCRARTGRCRACPGAPERRRRASGGARRSPRAPFVGRGSRTGRFAESTGREPAYQIAAADRRDAENGDRRHRANSPALPRPCRMPVRRPSGAVGVRIHGVRHGIVGLRPSWRFEQPRPGGKRSCIIGSTACRRFAGPNRPRVARRGAARSVARARARSRRRAPGFELSRRGRRNSPSPR